MRLPNPRLVRLSSVSPGAIMERGDGELIVSPLLQPVIDLSSPVDKVTPPGVALTLAQSDSFIKAERIFGTGATAGQGRVFSTFKKGMWALDIAATWMFTGTTNMGAGQFASVVLQDPEFLVANLFEFPQINGVQQSQSQSYTFVFLRDGFQLQINTPTFVALDNFYLSASANARQLL